MSSNIPKDENKKEEEKEIEGAAAKASTSEESHLGSTIEKNVEALRIYLAEKLGFSGNSGEAKDTILEKVLDQFSLEGIVNYIKENKCQNVITMAGAGISTTAGIPDFRSPGTGLYHNLQKYNLPHPQAIFELDFFHKNPKPFFELAKELYPGKFKPTICHYFIRLLAEKNILLRHYTQNIDTLERVAGIPEDKIVEAHGTFHTGHCLDCQKAYNLLWMKERIFKDEIPECEECNGIVKPDIVFFGESLPNKFYKLIETDFSKCDLLIILGSSLVVQPFASLVDRVNQDCPRILINNEKAGQRSDIMALMGIKGGLDYENSKNKRDVLWLGDCDKGCQLFADELGWGKELKELIKKEHAKIDENDNSEVVTPKLKCNQ